MLCYATVCISLSSFSRNHALDRDLTAAMQLTFFASCAALSSLQFFDGGGIGLMCGPDQATILKINIQNKTNLLLLIIFAFQYKFYLRENWLFLLHSRFAITAGSYWVGFWILFSRNDFKM